MTEDEQTIELSPLERMFTYLNLLGDFNTMSIGFLESNCALDQDVVTKALHIMQSRHPYFRAYLDIKRKEDKVFLKIMKSDDQLSRKIQLEWMDLNDETRESVIEKTTIFNSKMFEHGQKQLLWRVQVIKYDAKNDGLYKYCLNLAAHCVITDGMNILALLIEIVNIINSLATNTECEEMITKLVPIGNIYELSEQRGLFKRSEHDKKIKELEKLQKEKFLFDKKFGSKKSTNPEKGYKLDLFKLEKSLSEKILASCKKNDVKLTSYLNAVTFYSLKKLYDENGLKMPKKIIIDCPISLRIRYKPNLEFCHCGPHTAFATFQPDKKMFGDYVNFWKDCRNLNEALKEMTSTETGAAFSVTHNFKIIEAISQALAEAKTIEDVCRLFYEENECDVAVSNLGAFVNEKCKIFPGILDLKEVYVSDSMQSVPCAANGLIIHPLFWKEEIMIQLGANKWKFNTVYFNRFKALFLQMIEQSLLD